jgi:hypothetical protein
MVYQITIGADQPVAAAGRRDGSVRPLKCGGHRPNAARYCAGNCRDVALQRLYAPFDRPACRPVPACGKGRCGQRALLGWSSNSTPFAFQRIGRFHIIHGWPAEAPAGNIGLAGRQDGFAI